MSETVEPVETSKSEMFEPADEVEEVAPGILRIMLPMDSPALGHVNCYALPDRAGLSLIDPGLADGVSHEVLARRLDDAGLELARVHTCVITHSHFDHYGGVARLRLADTRTDVGIVAHESFGRVWHDAYDHIGEDSDALEHVELDSAEADEAISRFEALGRRYTRDTKWGARNEPLPARLLARFAAEGLSVRSALRPPDTDVAVVDGDRIRLGDRNWQVLHTPGHADDHLCLWSPDLGVLFSGDHVLPSITPHIGGFTHSEDPLADFLVNLERMEGLDGVSIVLPAHGNPFTDLAGRSRHIARHHHDRLDRVRSIGAEVGAASVEAFMRGLFRERSWGTLAESETFAHLEWLRIHEGAVRTDVEGLAVYEL